MAKLSAYKRNRDAVAAGEQIAVGSADEPFFLRVRGPTDAYRDALHRYQIDEANRLNRDVRFGETMFVPTNLPPSAAEAAQVRAIREGGMILGVEGIENDDGSAMTVEQYLAEMVDTPALVSWASIAINQVGTKRADARKASEGN